MGIRRSHLQAAHRNIRSRDISLLHDWDWIKQPPVNPVGASIRSRVMGSQVAGITSFYCIPDVRVVIRPLMGKCLKNLLCVAMMQSI